METTQHNMNTTNAFGALFTLGDLGVTPGAAAAFQEAFGDNARIAMLTLTLKHSTGDDGDLCDDDKAANVDAIQHGDRVFSCYHLPALADQEKGEKVWIITEADRSSTVIMLPEEY